MKNQDNNYEYWFEKGDHDIATAELIFDHKGFMDTTAFHVHQAVEKYLKGFLVFNNYDFPLIHNLPLLLKECSKFNQNIIDYMEECEKINVYYIESRYPNDIPQNYSRTEINKAIEMAKFIIKYIKNIIRKNI